MRRRTARAAVLLTLFAALAVPIVAHAAQLCGGAEITIHGSSEAEEITGTSGDDVIHGYGGADVIDGGGGDDIICGGNGADVISGGSGNDRIMGGRGADDIHGDEGNDVVHGNDGHDAIDGGPGDDRLLGGSGGDRLDGGADRDIAYGNDGNDLLIGGPQGDRLFGGRGADSVLGRYGNDIVHGGPHRDELRGGAGDDVLEGGPGSDLLAGGTGDDRGISGPGFDECLSTSRDDGCEGPVFLETFDFDAPSPTPLPNSASFSVSVNSRIGATQHQLAAMEADHGPDCAPLPATHTITAYEDAVYRCRDHLMTAVSSGLFTDRTNMAVAMFSPNQILDFSGGPATITYDASTLRASRRDWYDIWITPFDDLQRMPLQADRVLMQGPSENALVVSLRAFSSKGVFDASIFDGFVETEIIGSNDGYETVLTPSRTARSTFEIVIESDHLKVWMPEEGLVFIDQAIPELPFTRGIVQFGHNSYEVFECDEGCAEGPATWHWDDIRLAPAEPIRALPASRRFVNASTASFVSFPAPAPADSWIQFTAIGKELEVSFDSGATWLAAVTQHDRENYVWRYRNYWMPMPESATTMHVRGTNTAEHVWQFQDISILVRDDNG